MIIAAGDVRAWSGSDAGGKAATVRWMADHHTLVPEVGYWAAAHDPTSTYHPLIYTTRRGHHWIQVTSLPFAELSLPFYVLAGPAGLLVLPVLGSLLAALGAGRLARRLGSQTGWGSFWLVGLGASLFYAGDFWEHSAAVGLALLAVCLALEDGGIAGAAAAGALAGCAAVLRSEMLVYGAAFAFATLMVPDERRRWLRSPGRVIAAATAAALPLGVERLAERLVWGSAIGSNRVASLSTQAGTQAGSRLRDASVTTVGLIPDQSRLAIGLALVLLLIGIGYLALSAEKRMSPLAVGLIGGAGVLHLVRLEQGAGFIPGLFPAAPLAAVGIAALFRRRPGTVGSVTSGPAPTLASAGETRGRVVALSAIVALPLIWAFQWRGQLVPQWGGRYELLTGVLLTVVGVAAIERTDGWRRPASTALIVFALAATSLGAVWHIERTRDYARAIGIIDRIPASVVVVTTLQHLGREGGAFYGDRRWLAVPNVSDTPGALALAHAEGAALVDLVLFDSAPPKVVGWEVGSWRPVPLHGFVLQVWRYQWVGP